MTPERFDQLVETVREYLENQAVINPASIAACRSGEDFELCVRNAVEVVLEREGIRAEIKYEQGSHTFPDIVLVFEKGEKYGIEVKCSTGTGRSWKINGNSVLGSTKEDVRETYVLFGKTAMGYQAFRCKRYEECAADVAVTHSPRFRIDMELAPGTTFFEKSGLSYQQISSAQNPIELITDYFKSQGQRAWWLAESTPAAIRMLSNLPVEERKALLGYCFAHFPEVFSSGGTKYSRCAMWLASEHSIVSSSLRDNFSAGGKVDYGRFGKVAKVFQTLEECRPYVLAALENATPEELYADWGWKYQRQWTDCDKYVDWEAAVADCCPIQTETGLLYRLLIRDIMQK